MISNFNNYTRKDDIKLVTIIILVFLFIVWFCSPAGNKFLQIRFWGNNTRFLITKLTNNSETTAYKFYRNNAVYLAKMYKNKDSALREMDKAIQSVPAYISDKELKNLYKDRANIRICAGDYKGALNDFIQAENITFQDYLKIALLYKEVGMYKQAMSFCNAILNVDNTAYSGFACLAYLYDTAGRTDIAIKVWDLALDRRKNNARAYADRALLKKKIGDFEGYKEDLAKAKEIFPTIDIEQSIIKDTLQPKVLSLSIL